VLVSITTSLCDQFRAQQMPCHTLQHSQHTLLNNGVCQSDASNIRAYRLLFCGSRSLYLVVPDGSDVALMCTHSHPSHRRLSTTAAASPTPLRWMAVSIM